eukprot:TRINITY_DN9715_c0_g2_i2.p1 TRINITY_DN9715_c0_g2~~TRINITY_DN9715_c0_g2_i2.p1  ORF type:complete len:186 (-),score=3.43 TRINITY_DN9715_c0_g2_i2:60-617(-)
MMGFTLALLASMLAMQIASASIYGTMGEWNNLNLNCGSGKIDAIEFASFGTPDDKEFKFGNCHSPNSMKVAKEECLGQKSCSIEVTNTRFGGDPCYTVPKRLTVVAHCDSDTTTDITTENEVSSICGTSGEFNNIKLECPFGLLIRSIKFASFGSPTGDCGRGYEFAPVGSVLQLVLPNLQPAHG